VAAVRLLDAADVRLVGTTVRSPSLDEVFLALTGSGPPSPPEGRTPALAGVVPVDAR
jgi:hypothetical protein